MAYRPGVAPRHYAEGVGTYAQKRAPGSHGERIDLRPTGYREQNETIALRLLDMIEALHPPWHARAACRGATDPNLWFPENRTLRTDEALAICAVCPVVKECAEAGRAENFGIWGGKRRSERFVEGKQPRRPIPTVEEAGTWCSTFYRIASETTERKHRTHGMEPCDPCRAAFKAAKVAREQRTKCTTDTA